MPALSDADYVVLVLQQREEPRSKEISSRLESGELQLRPKDTLADKVGKWFFLLLTIAVVAWFIAFCAGLAKSLLQWAW